MKSHPMTRSAFASLGFLLILTISQAMSLLENFQLDPKKVEEIQNELLLRVITPEDGELRREVKVILVKYLVETTINDYMKQIRGSRQDDGDGDGAAEAADPDQVYNGVRRLLQNVFSGNLIGVIQEGVSIRSPGRVQEFFSDVMGALFGSAAVKGAGTIGVAILNATASPLNTTELPPGAIAQQQQQYNPALVGLNGVALPQQQQQLGGVAGVPAVAPLRGNSRPINYQRPGSIAAVNNVNNVNNVNAVPATQESDNEDDENDDFYK